ncbi:MAG: iron chelate uptake ABC transporter family permease subunit [Armatimonadetes bacterium]|nr:iron chelate uptake ABC transporter family permease subunit [Anaerolineae bacterium]
MSQPILKPFPPLAVAHLPASALPRLKLGIQPAILVGLLAALIAVFLLSLVIGSVSIPLEQTISVLLGGEAERASWTAIILKIRLPKALTAMLAGAALSIAGLLRQTLFRKPLESSDVLGINSGAGLGGAFVVL